MLRAMACVVVVSLVGTVLLAVAVSGQEKVPASGPGLTIQKGGVVLLDGEPYRGIGINYFSLFYDHLLKQDDMRYRDGLQALAEHRIPFARFMATAFWPAHMELYRTDRQAYYKLMDDVVREAEQAGVGLIPSLFWHIGMVPDFVGEPVNQWGDPGSKTRRFMRSYTEEFVRRYKDSPAIWAWEFGNEYNLPANLPNADKHRPKTNVNSGTPATRSEKDDVTGEMMVSAFTDFARTVRAIDPHRAIFSGNSIPRPYAYHNWTENSWTRDTPEQYTQMLLRDNPDPIDTLTIHLYARKQKEYFADQQAGLADIVRVSMAAATGAGKPLFIGEFGAGRDQWEADGERARVEELIGIIESQRVPLAAVWVFDLRHQEGTHNITPDNERAYILDLVAQANTRIAAGQNRP